MRCSAIRVWRPEGAWFWATHGGAELDLLVSRGGRHIGVEIKRADAPRLSASMRQALQDLDLDRLLVVTPGDRGYTLNERTRVVSLAEALAVA
jgi:hypothetical protein